MWTKDPLHSLAPIAERPLADLHDAETKALLTSVTAASKGPEIKVIQNGNGRNNLQSNAEPGC